MINPKYLLIIFVFISCQGQSETKQITSDLLADIENEKGNRSSNLIPEPDIMERLKNQKAMIDKLQIQQKLELEVLVKDSNNDKLTIVLNENWPENIETTYNVWKDESGSILVIGEYPTSESGDWHIEYFHYFDQKENTFAFQRNTNFFNSMCTDDIAYETIEEYYDSDFNRVDRIYSLTDKNKQALKKQDCELNYDYPFDVSNNLISYLKRISLMVRIN